MRPTKVLEYREQAVGLFSFLNGNTAKTPEAPFLA